MRRISGNKSDVRADAEAPARMSTRRIAKSMLPVAAYSCRTTWSRANPQA